MEGKRMIRPIILLAFLLNGVTEIKGSMVFSIKDDKKLQQFI